MESKVNRSKNEFKCAEGAVEGHARIRGGPERSSMRLTKTRAGPSGGSPAGCQRPGRQRRRGRPPARTAVWRRRQAGSGRVLGAGDTRRTLLSLIGEGKRARHRRSRTVLRMRGNLEVQAMIQDSRPRLYPRISLLSCPKKKAKLSLQWKHVPEVERTHAPAARRASASSH